MLHFNLSEKAHGLNNHNLFYSQCTFGPLANLMPTVFSTRHLLGDERKHEVCAFWLKYESEYVNFTRYQINITY